jgi:hypothetical protein
VEALDAGVTRCISAATGTGITIGAVARSKSIATDVCMRPLLWFSLDQLRFFAIYEQTTMGAK